MADDILHVGQSMYNEDYYIDPSLRSAFREFQLFLVEPFTVTSVWRSQQVNHFVGGSDHSYHLYGKAVDLTVGQNDKLNIEDWIYSGSPSFYRWLDKHNIVEFIIYKGGHIHFAADPNKLGLHRIVINGNDIDLNQANFKRFIENAENDNRLAWLRNVALGAGVLAIVFNFKYIFRS